MHADRLARVRSFRNKHVNFISLINRELRLRHNPLPYVWRVRVYMRVIMYR